MCEEDERFSWKLNIKLSLKLIKDFYVFNMAIKSEVSIELLFVNGNQMIYLYLFIFVFIIIIC